MQIETISTLCHPESLCDRSQFGGLVKEDRKSGVLILTRDEGIKTASTKSEKAMFYLLISLVFLPRFIAKGT
ncbi:MAG TPA: hypothetical protein VJ574_03030 [Candidatus Bathyarchaeia archaeon]|nr:hypothetical protein [Candidatus Bathyarchaeia archaeon]